MISSVVMHSVVSQVSFHMIIIYTSGQSGVATHNEAIHGELSLYLTEMRDQVNEPCSLYTESQSVDLNPRNMKERFIRSPRYQWRSPLSVSRKAVIHFRTRIII